MKLHVRIVGIRPLLMHSPKAMFDQVWMSDTDKKKQVTAFKKDKRLEAESAAYRDEEGFLYIPANCILAALTQAAKKFGKVENSGLEVGRFDITIAERIKGSVVVEPQNPRLLDPATGKELKDYVVQLDKVKIGKDGIIRARAKVPEWATEFDLVWNPTLFDLVPDNVKTAMELAGNLGLLDWRPTHGLFKVEQVSESE